MLYNEMGSVEIRGNGEDAKPLSYAMGLLGISINIYGEIREHLDMKYNAPKA